MSARVVLISGANRGIGAAIADRLAADGWNLSLGMRKPEAAPERFKSHHVCFYDANRPGCEADWVKSATNRFGRIDAVVNSAGIMTPKSVIDVEEAEIRAMLDVNVVAPLRLVKAAWDGLSRSGRGRVVTIVSLSGKRVKLAASGAYSVSKFAALALSHAIRHSGWDLGIRSTAICPGLVATDMAFAISSTPAGEMTPPEDVARIVALALDLPNTASVAEIPINCKIEEAY
ncbi:MAG: SDR family NAD(P)-dependent oxidoreductase [Roseiarcus sp.]|jgi:NAD(P)-dependent dehydrogenase (short-subunit alcohol dehydrogenase family)